MDPYRHLRQECLEANLALPKNGLVDLTFGNVSVADAERNLFAIKPSGMEYEQLTAEEIVVVDLSGGEVIAGARRPSTDTPTHRRLLQAFAPQGIRSIVHTHSREAVAWAQAGLGIPCLGTTHADYFPGEVPVTRPLTPAEIQGDYEWATGDAIVERFADLDPARLCAVLVHGHGPFAWGASWAAAVENAFTLEMVAGLAAGTLQLNPQTPPLSTVLLHKHFERKHGATAYYGQKP